MDESGTDLLRAIGGHGAVLTARAGVMEATPGTWEEMVRAGLLRLTRTTYGDVVSLGARGRVAYRELTGEGAAYLECPGTVATRAFQVEAVEHLEPEFVAVGAIYKAAGGLPGQSKQTDQIRALRMWPTAKGEMSDEERAPLLYALGAGAPVTMRAVRRLQKLHRGDVIRWGHRLLIAVPQHRCPPEVRLGVAALEGRVGSPNVSRFDVPHLILVPLADPSGRT